MENIWGKEEHTKYYTRSERNGTVLVERRNSEIKRDKKMDKRICPLYSGYENAIHTPLNCPGTKL
jgi:hypothetical protein